MSILHLLQEHFDLSAPVAEPEPVAAPAPPARPTTSDGYEVAYAYSPRESVRSGGRYHLITREAIAAGRLHRVPGDALCKPMRKFWGMDGGRTPEDFERHGCSRCREIRDHLKKECAP